MKNILAICFVLLGYVGLYAQDAKSDTTILDGRQFPSLILPKGTRQPQFIGDIGKYLAYNIKYPADAENKNIQGTVYVSFIVGKDGSVSTAKVVKSIEGAKSLEKESLRVIYSMPKWKPGMQNGAAVRVQYMVPIRYVLKGDFPKKG